MDDASYVVSDLDSMIEFAKEGIVSKTLTDQPRVKVVLFCMSAGQSLSEHTASVPATVHVLKGEGTITLDKKDFEASPGTWVFMPQKQLHALSAKKDMVFLLHLSK
ncbi:MAG: cupin domain-containing protein [Thermoplasmata archaeon]|nr:cupin domain-containing protein [Thermoplasmata archaeon]